MSAQPSTPSGQQPDGQPTARQQPTAQTPRPGECVLCYTLRMVDTHGCDSTLRWALTWRDQRVPTATGLAARLGHAGGYCDCEVFINGWTLREELLVFDTDADDDDLVDLIGEWPATAPDCDGVAATSTDPCGVWTSLRPGR
jgi:hypothetical protein